MIEYIYTNDYERNETQKYEGTYTSEEIALNRRLYEECSKDTVDFSLVEELLKAGADPLGGTAVCGWGLLEHVYGELLFNARDSKSIHIVKITELFLKYGMEIQSPRVPYDNDNSIHPLRHIPENEDTIAAVKLLLDHGVDADSVGEYWATYFFDQFNVCGDDPNDDELHERFVCAMKMVMLIASYDHVLENDEDLQKIIGCKYNTYDVHNFRDWNNYSYEFDTSRCERKPELYRSVVTIREKNTNETVWKIAFHLEESEF